MITDKDIEKAIIKNCKGDKELETICLAIIDIEKKETDEEVKLSKIRKLIDDSVEKKQ